MIHTDTQASGCYSCNGTRATYTMPNKGRGTASKRCLNPACRKVVHVEAAADVARKVTPSLEATRQWWNQVYG